MSDDVEILAMQQIVSALKDLEPEAQARTIKWAIDRFEINKIGQKGTEIVDLLIPDKTQPNGHFDTNVLSNFGDFPSLFDAAHPIRGPERALVTGYWLQVCQSKETFEGAEVNSELKHLGHGLSNVTDSLSSLMGRRPALALQVRKSGRSRQARKQYKLTQEGIRFVQKMINTEAFDDDQD